MSDQMRSQIQAERNPEQGTDELGRLSGENTRLREEADVAALRSEAQAKLAAIVESSDDAIVSKTLDGVIRTWNKGAERIFGYKAEEVVGKAINIIIPPDRQAEEPHILSQIGAGNRVDHFETVRMRKDGRLIDVSVTISPVRDATGRIIGASKIARDITHQKQIERELKEARDAAETANRAKDHFLSILSHELRTPLMPVLAEMSFMETRQDIPPDLREDIVMMRRNVETEARLVDDLLDITRISRGKVQLHFEVIDVHESVRAAVAMLQSAIDEKQMELSLALRARQHHVWADAGRIQQVFLNLLSNALKFTARAGKISIRTTSDNSRIEVKISDTGIGIDSENLSRIFGAFEQGSRARRFGGLGLGLSIAKSLVDLHSGIITACSAGPDQGSTFSVTLNSVPADARSGNSERPLLGKSHFRVLLVEDHADTRSIMTRLLESFGCSVVATGSVSEALGVAEQADFDVLISDIGLPDGNGMDIMRTMKARKPIRGIAVSGFGQDEDIRRSHSAGFDAHLIKPVNLRMLRDAVQKVAVS